MRERCDYRKDSCSYIGCTINGEWMCQRHRHMDEVQALRDERDRLKDALEAIMSTDRGLEGHNREAHKRYIADDDWWEEKRPSKTFEAWIAKAALTPAGGDST